MLLRGKVGLECAKLLINARADVSHRAMLKNPAERYCFNDLGRGHPMALHVIQTGESEKLDLLLDAGYPVDLSTSTGYTAMMWASKAGSVPMIKRLVEAKADPMRVKLKEDKKCNSPLFVVFTCEYGFKRYCNVAGALRTVANPDKLKDVLNFYFDAKMDPHWVINSAMFPFTLSLHMWSLWFSYNVYANEDMSVQQLLLDRKVPVESYSGSSFYMSHLVPFMVFNATAVKWWLDNKADINKKSWFTGTFYDTSVMFNNKVCIDTYNDWILMKSIEEPKK